MDDIEGLLQLRKQGFFCSQMILIQGMELLGKDNPDLLRSMNGLAGGLGFTGELCGALTAGACLLGLYAGKGRPEDQEDPRLLFMIEDLLKWFKEEYETRFGGIRCEEILEVKGAYAANRCPLIVSSTFQKCKELLVENNFDLSGIEV
jgi:C_GCAxxG_C_C family probable redox protein